MTNNRIQVLAHRGQTAEFTVPNGISRKEVEAAIAEKLRSNEGIVWINDPEGLVNVDTIRNKKGWKPQRVVLSQ